ncbi:hypothetical protein IGI04_037712 [Brassica rapa subsp. trilocularis]|uniref:Uncharacterized protein n=1 Tax=Brassica rapa subsp. trilocularis TaxID=1813537 RepID=A0ABQ7LI77_BRACM|nr:hypothetical protein IGI04_037712 [Brassica rapa subsp. trilocularis]
MKFRELIITEAKSVTERFFQVSSLSLSLSFVFFLQKPISPQIQLLSRVSRLPSDLSEANN